MRDERTRYVYGIVETGGECRYTRAFDGLAPAPFNKIWTRFADTQAVPTTEARLLREKDPFGNPISFVRLLHGSEIHGDVPGAHDGDVTRAIADAVSPLGGADPTLTKSIAIADAPALVRAALTAASNEIENRTFEGTDYSAGVEGIYIVYDSPAKTNIVAYVVYGTGSGEPDYHDGIVIGFDASGTRVYDESDSG